MVVQKQIKTDKNNKTYDNSIFININQSWIYLFKDCFEFYGKSIKYAKTKENADILIAAVKLLEGLK